jgi:hypothetical protein
VKGAVELPVLSDAAPQDRLKVRQIRDVNDLINALHKRAHGIVGGKAMTEKNDEILASFGARAFDHRSKNRILSRIGSFEVFVNNDDVVAVGLQLQEHVLLEEAEVDLVGHVDQLRHHHFLVLLMIDANERSVIAQIEKGRFL